MLNRDRNLVELGASTISVGGCASNSNGDCNSSGSRIRLQINVKVFR